MKAMDILTRREVEARIVAPLFEAYAAEIGRERALEILRQVIQNIARQQGAELAQQTGGDTLSQFTSALEAWKQGDAMQLDLLEQNDAQLSFNVTALPLRRDVPPVGHPGIRPASSPADEILP